MAEKVVGLRIELNGFRGVVTNIKQLEDELRKAKEDLQELEIGSENFKTLTREIAKAETQVIGFKKSAQGLAPSQAIEGWGKLAAGITSSFAAATAAAELFGSDSEEVTKAVATAQNLLTIALSARSIAELELGASIVARTIADKAATAAIETENVALKALYTTIAANPIGALVAGIALLTTAVIAFADSEEKALDVSKEVAKTTSDEASKLKVYETVLTSANSTNNQRKRIIDELKKTYPGFNAFIDEENRLNKDGKIFLDAKIKSLILEAQTKLIVQKIAENNNKILAIENQTVEESVTGWQKLKNAILGTSTVYSLIGTQALNQADAIKNNATATGKLTTENENWLKSLSKVLEDAGKLDQTLDPLNGKLSKQAKTEKDLANNTNEAVKATDAQIASQKALEAQITQTNETYSTLLDKLKDIVDVTLIQTPEPKIIKDLEAIVSARKAVIPEDLKDKFKEIGYNIELVGGKIIGLTKEPKQELEKLGLETVFVGDQFMGLAKIGEQSLNKLGQKTGELSQDIEDKFGKLYDKLRETLSFDAINQDVFDFGFTIQNVLNQAQEQLASGLITKEAFDALKKITEQYQKLNTVISEIPNLKKILQPDALKDYFEIQRKISIAQKEILYDYDETTGKVITLNAASINYGAEVDKQNKQLADFQEKIKDYYTAEYFYGRQKIDQIIQSTNLTREQKKELLATAEAGGQKVYEVIGQIAKLSVDGLQTITKTIIAEENEIRGFLAKAQELRNEARSADATAIKGTLLNNLALLFDFTQKENKVVIDSKKTQNEQITALSDDLSKKGIDISQYTEEEKLKILKFYLDLQNKAEEDANKKELDIQKKRVENWQKALAIISKSISDLASLTAQSFQLQLDILQSNYETTLSQIVGDTEQANQKRLELEKEYQAEKRQIEKEAQLTALKFTLAQAIASSAQAIITALATLGPVFGPISAAITAGITAAQIAVISEQISQVQSSKRRGGLLAGGGLVQGPSHEQGGVYAGGGFVLEGNEAVINRQSTLKYAGLLSQINESGGGRPITVQAPMDSRLVEALAKQNSEPIRAYVVESDISKAQAINKRLEQLASF
jgi:hypothetical protein